jgi:hypothetical protein
MLILAERRAIRTERNCGRVADPHHNLCQGFNPAACVRSWAPRRIDLKFGRLVAVNELLAGFVETQESPV